MNNLNRQTGNGKINILYQRLSREDGDKAESESIQNQRRILEEYAEKNGFTPYINVHDDGYSGTNWNRPGWQEVMAKVEAGEVNALLCKDSTRIGRDYVRMGILRETFEAKNVRLICVNDGFDSINGNDDFTPFRDILAEMYAKDTSKKIKSVLSRKGRDGKPLGSVPMYGYKKHPNDRNIRIIDEESAAVVRRIFQMTVEGKGIYQIARTLMEEKVERPSYYMYRTGIVASPGKCNMSLPYNWRGNTVAMILQKREYMGDLVNFKTYKPSFKSKKQVPNTPENQLVFEGALPQIIDRETWELAQKLRQTARRPKGEYEANPLTGLLFCSDCGSKLHNRRSHYTEDIRGNKIFPVDTYECMTYRSNAEKFVDK